MKRLLLKNSCAILVALVCACSSSSALQLKPAPDALSAPAWVKRGSASIQAPSGRHFVGVGELKMQGSYSATTRGADKNAKHSLHKLISNFSEVAARTYIAKLSVQSAVYDGAQIRSQLQRLVSRCMQQAEIVGHWHDKSENKIISIAAFDFGGLAARIRNDNQLDSGFRVFFKYKGEQVFDELAVPQ